MSRMSLAEADGMCELHVQIPSEHGPTGDEVEADDYIEFDPFAPTPPWDSKAEDMLAINAKLADRSRRSLQMLE